MAEPKKIVLNREYLSKILKKQQSVKREDELHVPSNFVIPEIFEEDAYFGLKRAYRIIEIGESLFEGTDNLFGVVLPDSIIRIGKKAFKDCKSLSKIKLPESLKQIESEAFANCTGFSGKDKVLEIPSSVELIFSNAFANVPCIFYEGEASVIGNNPFWGAVANLAVNQRDEEQQRQQEEQQRIAEEKAKKESGEKAKKEAEEKARKEEEERRAEEEKQKQKQLNKNAKKVDYPDYIDLEDIPHEDDIPESDDGDNVEQSGLDKAEEKARKEAEQQRQRELQEKARQDAEAKERQLAEERRKAEEEKRQLQEKARQDAEAKERQLAEEARIAEEEKRKAKEARKAEEARKVQQPFRQVQQARQFQPSTQVVQPTQAGQAKQTLKHPEEKTLSLSSEWFNYIFNLKGGQKYREKQFRIPATYENNNTIYRINHIVNGLFEDCDILEKVILPDSIEKIGQDAFRGCTNLIEINLPKSLKVIESNAFYGCSSLSTDTEPFVIPETVEEINQDAFKDVEYIRYEGKATGEPWGAKKMFKLGEQKVMQVGEKNIKFDESILSSFVKQLGDLIDLKVNAGISEYKEFAENQEIRKLEARNASLEHEIREKSDALQTYNTTIEGLQTQIKGFEASKAYLTKQLEEKTKELDQQKTANGNKDSYIITLSTDNKNLKATNKDLSEKNAKLVADVGVKEKELTKATEEKAQLQEQARQKLDAKEKQLTEERRKAEEEKRLIQEEHKKQIALKDQELEKARQNAGASAQEIEDKLAGLRAEKQDVENALEAHKVLYSDFDELYACYKEIPDDIKLNLQNLFGKEDSVLSIVFNITKSRNVESFWQYICDRIDNNELTEHIDNFRKIFGIAFKLLQLVDPNYVLLEPNEGDIMNNANMKRNKQSSQSGVVKKVLLKGIKYQVNNRIVKQTLVLLG